MSRYYSTVNSMCVYLILKYQTFKLQWGMSMWKPRGKYGKIKKFETFKTKFVA